MLGIAFLGLGIMGRAMSKNLLQAGHQLTVFNRTQAKTREIEALGAKAAGSPKEAARLGDVIIVMVTGPEAIDELLWGENGAGSALAPGKTLINMSTVPPDYAASLDQRIRDTGADFVDAPVSGSKKPAEEGTLVILAGGGRESVEDLSPLFLAMGKKVVYCGPAGAGSMMKMTVNLLLGVMVEGLAEAVAFGEKGDLSRDLIMDTVLAGPMSCGLFQLKDMMLRNREYPPQFPLKHMAKDLRFVLQTGYRTGAATPAAHAALQQYAAGEAKRLGEEDFAAVKKILDG